MLRTMFVLMQPLVCPWTGRYEWPTHTTAGLVLYCIISLKLNIIFQLFLFELLYVMNALTAEIDIFFVLLLMASELLVPS